MRKRTLMARRASCFALLQKEGFHKAAQRVCFNRDLHKQPACDCGFVHLMARGEEKDENYLNANAPQVKVHSESDTLKPGPSYGARGGTPLDTVLNPARHR